MYALISIVVLGGMSVIALIVNRLKPSPIKTAAIFTVVVSLVSFGLGARTVYFGGQIRHTEITADAAQSNGAARGGEKDND